MTDEKLIAEVARVWVDGGGDAEGLDWCHQQLKEAVNAEIENRLMLGQAQEQEEQEREMVTVTREMAMDAGFPEMEGARIQW